MTNPVIRMTASQRKKVVALIKKLCANCDDGNCLLLDDGESTVCPQTLTYSLCCTYFKAAVLPADPVLSAELLNRDNGKQCTICGKPFTPTGNRAKYCRDCARKAYLAQKADYARKQRVGMEN